VAIAGEVAKVFPALWGLWAFHIVSAELRTARKLADELKTLGDRHLDRAISVQVYWALGMISFWTGDMVDALDQFEKGIAAYEPQQHRSYAFMYASVDPGVVCRCYCGWTLWHLGYPQQALESMKRASILAEELSHPYSQAWVLTSSAWLHLYRREGRLAQQCAEAAIAISDDQGFLLVSALGTMLRGAAFVEQGEGERAVAELNRGLVAWRATGSELGRPLILSFLAPAHVQRGQLGEAQSVLGEALALVEKTDERLHEAELYRQRGDFLLVAPDENPTAAATFFRRAIEIARHQSARSLELRATRALSRLLQEQGKKGEARKMLADIYGWFTEGFDTADLKEAKELLDELS
jgi:predicted ATPase